MIRRANYLLTLWDYYFKDISVERNGWANACEKHV